MRERYTITTNSVGLPVSLEDMKSHLRVDFDAEDLTILGLIEVARDWVETRIGRTLINRTYTLRRDCFPAGCFLELKFPPLASVTEVRYYDADNTLQTLAAEKYQTIADHFLSSGLELLPDNEWPTTTIRSDAVQVEFVAGYGSSSSSVPAAAKHAIKMLVGHWYENREAVVVGTITKEIEIGVEGLLLTLSKVYVPGATL